MWVRYPVDQESSGSATAGIMVSAYGATCSFLLWWYKRHYGNVLRSMVLLAVRPDIPTMSSIYYSIILSNLFHTSISYLLYCVSVLVLVLPCCSNTSIVYWCIVKTAGTGNNTFVLTACAYCSTHIVFNSESSSRGIACPPPANAAYVNRRSAAFTFAPLFPLFVWEVFEGEDESHKILVRNIREGGKRKA